jgi:alpha-beta hydrolase superfamily lysophospholipase
MRRFRFLTALVAGLIAQACVSFPQAPQAVTAPALDGERLRTVDGAELPVAVWRASEPRAVILALHGMNDYSHAFAMPGAAWAKHAGITTYAIDQRGFGGQRTRWLLVLHLRRRAQC